MTLNYKSLSLQFCYTACWCNLKDKQTKISTNVYELQLSMTAGCSMITSSYISIYSHVNVRRLEASLVDVVEGERLSGVGAVLVHLHSGPVASLWIWLSLRLLPPCCHDLWQGEGHGARDQMEECKVVAAGCCCFRTVGGLSLPYERLLTSSNPWCTHSPSDLRRQHHVLLLHLQRMQKSKAAIWRMTYL